MLLCVSLWEVCSLQNIYIYIYMYRTQELQEGRQSQLINPLQQVLLIGSSQKTSHMEGAGANFKSTFLFLIFIAASLLKVEGAYLNEGSIAPCANNDSCKVFECAGGERSALCIHHRCRCPTGPSLDLMNGSLSRACNEDDGCNNFCSSNYVSKCVDNKCACIDYSN